MVKTWPFVPREALDIPSLITVIVNNEAIRWNTSGEDIPIGDDLYPSEVSEISSLDFVSDGTPSSCTIKLTHREDGPLSDALSAIGRYDGCRIQVHAVDRGDPDAGVGEEFVGRIGSIRTNVAGSIELVCRGPLAYLRGDISERYGVMCRAEFGDRRCKKVVMPDDIERSTAYVTGHPINSFVRVSITSSPATADYQNLYWECTTAGTTAGSQPGGYSGASPGATVTDGDAVFTARNAYTRSAVVLDVLTPQSFSLEDLPDPRAGEGGTLTYALGVAIIRSGPYSGTAIPISSWDPLTVTTNNPEPLVRSWFICSHMMEPGTLIEIIPGCDKREVTCFTVFDNIINRRAETFAPGADAAMAQA